MLAHNFHVQVVRFTMLPYFFHRLIQLFFGGTRSKGRTGWVVVIGRFDFYVYLEGFWVIVVAHFEIIWLNIEDLYYSKDNNCYDGGRRLTDASFSDSNCDNTKLAMHGEYRNKVEDLFRCG